MNKYYSQYKQDEFIDKVVFNKKKKGFFVDIGAHDGVNFSNSYFFEKERGYEGICIEPNPNVFLQLKKNRECEILNACIGDKTGTVKFLAIEGYSEMLSGIVEQYHPKHLERIEEDILKYGGAKHEIAVVCTQLQNIEILKNRTIDYVSIDTEGNELSILNSIDFSKFKAICFSIENNYGDTAIKNIMIKNGYEKVYRLGDDDIYLLATKCSYYFKIRRTVFSYVFKIKNKWASL